MFTPFTNPPDRFDTTKIIGQAQLSNEQRTIQLAESTENYTTVYGQASITGGRYEWVIRIDKCGAMQAVIGVATSSALAMISGKFSDEPSGYGFSVNGIFRTGGKLVSHHNQDCR